VLGCGLTHGAPPTRNPQRRRDHPFRVARQEQTESGQRNFDQKRLDQRCEELTARRRGRHVEPCVDQQQSRRRRRCSLEPRRTPPGRKRNRDEQPAQRHVEPDPGHVPVGRRVCRRKALCQHDYPGHEDERGQPEKRRDPSCRPQPDGALLFGLDGGHDCGNETGRFEIPREPAADATRRDLFDVVDSSIARRSSLSLGIAALVFWAVSWSWLIGTGTMLVRIGEVGALVVGVAAVAVGLRIRPRPAGLLLGAIALALVLGLNLLALVLY